MGKRLNTRMPAQGAEFLVLGHVLMHDIECYKAYTNFPGYDLMATNPYTGKVARISVKSRWSQNKRGRFEVDNLGCDFVVHVALNRAKRKRGITYDDTPELPEYYIFPVQVIEQVITASDKVNISNIKNCSKYRDAWHLISGLGNCFPADTSAASFMVR